MPIRLFLVLFLCVVPGCALLRGDTPSSGQEDFKWVARSDDAPAVDPSQVEVVFFDGQARA